MRPNNGAPCIADPRLGVEKGYTNKRQILAWDGPASTVTGTPDIQSGLRVSPIHDLAARHGQEHLGYRIGMSQPRL